MLKKSILYLLIATLLLNVIGIFVLHIVKEIEAKNNFIRNNPSLLVQIDVNQQFTKDFVWIKKGHEFTFKGEMFDVVKITTSSKTKKFLCINDSYEKKINSLFYKLTKEKKGHKKQTHSTTFYLAFELNFNLDSFVDYYTKNTFNYLFNLPNIFLKNSKNPPEIV